MNASRAGLTRARSSRGTRRVALTGRDEQSSTKYTEFYQIKREKHLSPGVDPQRSNALCAPPPPALALLSTLLCQARAAHARTHSGRHLGAVLLPVAPHIHGLPKTLVKYLVQEVVLLAVDDLAHWRSTERERKRQTRGGVSASRTSEAS